MLCNRNPIHFPRQLLAGPKNQRKHNKIKIQSPPTYQENRHPHRHTLILSSDAHKSTVSTATLLNACSPYQINTINSYPLPPWAKVFSVCCNNLPPSAPRSHCGERGMLPSSTLQSGRSGRSHLAYNAHTYYCNFVHQF